MCVCLWCGGGRVGRCNAGTTEQRIISLFGKKKGKKINQPIEDLFLATVFISTLYTFVIQIYLDVFTIHGEKNNLIFANI